jgi:site-specific recombinase XerD
MNQDLDRFITYLTAERNASPYTIRNYRSEIEECLAFLGEEGARTWDQVGEGMLQNYLNWLTERELAQASIARRVSELRSFGHWLVREDRIPANPFAGLNAPRLPKRLPTTLEVQEVEALLAAPDPTTPQGQRDRAILEMLYASGLRVSELVGLDLDSVSANRRELRIRARDDKERLVLLGRPAAAALDRYLSDGRLKLLGKRPTSALFLNRLGTRLTARSVQMILDRYSKVAGLLTPTTPQVLRHTFAAHMLDGGADLRVVQELLGHAQLSTTQVYAQVSQAHAGEDQEHTPPRGGQARVTAERLAIEEKIAVFEAAAEQDARDVEV